MNKLTKISINLLLSTFIFLLLPFNFSLVCAQAPDTLWTRVYGGTNWDYARSVQQTSDGGYVIVGTTESIDSGDVYFIKTDADGDTIWTKTYGYADFSFGCSVQETFDGGYIIVGGTGLWSYISRGVYLIKTDINGDTAWTKTYGGGSYDVGHSIQQTPDSGYVLVGTTSSFGAGWEDVYLLKVDRNGDTIWTKTFGGSDMDFGNSIALTPDNGYIIGGMSYSTTNGAGDIYIIKTDQNGDTMWTQIYGDSSYEWGASIAVTSDNGYIVTGEKTMSGNINIIPRSRRLYSLTGQQLAPLKLQSIDVWILKLDTVGDTIWTRNYGGSERDCGYSVQQTNDGGYIIAGNTKSFGAGDYDIYLIKTDGNGDSIWTKTYGGLNNDCGYSIQQTSDDGYIVAGYTESFGAGYYDVWLLKIAPEPGIAEDITKPTKSYSTMPTIITGHLLLPVDNNYKVFDITGREIDANRLAPGIYFIQVDNEIVTKVVKIK
jgi:hypothetical protein